MWFWKGSKLVWYDHKPDPVGDSEQFKLLWNFKSQTDHHIEHKKSDIVLLNKEEKSCTVIACPFGTKIVRKERERIDNYSDFLKLFSNFSFKMNRFNPKLFFLKLGH